MSTSQYWIQEQAPAGNFFNSVGLPEATTKGEAEERAKSWQKSFPHRKVRLALVVTTPVLEDCR